MKLFVTSSYGYWGAFNPNDLRDPNAKRQIGGGETAMLNMAKAMAARGHDVTVFHDLDEAGEYDRVQYLPKELLVSLATVVPHDVLVAWDDPMTFRYCDKARKHVLCYQLNDAVVGVFDHVIDRYYHPSVWHAERFASMFNIPQSKQRVQLTNGIDPYRYTQEVGRDPLRVIYSSSPDRGLHHLLAAWPKVIEFVPNASLHVFYEMDKWLELTFQLEAQGLVGDTTERAHILRQFRQNPPPNVHFHGGVGQWELAREQLRSTILAYPCDPVQPTEGFSMTCLEAIAAGCTLLTTDADALGELWSEAPDTIILPRPVDPLVWADTIVKVLTNPRDRVPRLPDGLTWSYLAKLWEDDLND